VKKICLLATLIIAPLLAYEVLEYDGHRTYPAEYSRQDHQDVKYLIHAMAKYHVGKLWLKESNMDVIKQRLLPQHPLAFLGLIFAIPENRALFPKVRTRTFYLKSFGKKRPSFLGSLGASLNREADCNNLNQHVDEFAKQVGVDPELIREHIEKRHWGELVDQLIASVPRNADRYDAGDM